MSEKSGKLIAVWGAPHSGKTTFAAALGTAIADTYAAATVIVLHSDIEAPMLSVLFPNAKSGSLGSVGIPLSANEPDTEQILANCTETKARPTLAVMGYRDGDTRLTYGVVTVTVNLANRDTTLSYRGIPVTLLYDGDVLTTRTVDFSPGGTQTLTFTVSVGQAEGEHTVTARVNWADRTAEKQPNDNEQSAAITVQTEDYAQSVETVTPNGDYLAGDEVITAFLIYHDGTNDILPSMGNRATLTVYAPDGTIFMTKALENIAVPAGKCNLIWFRWTVPDACAGQSLRLECTVNADGILPEDDRSNNTATVWVDVKEHFVSVTPDPSFDDATPAELPTAPNGFVGRVRWNEWVYADDGFVLKEYTVSLSGTAIITPNTSSDTLRGGGGFSLSVTPIITGDTASTTLVQAVLAAFPEFSYRTGTGECRNLERTASGDFQFPVHPSASARVHFLPLGIADGTYTVLLQLSGLWTPAGQVSSTVTVRIPIAGTVYDGFYIR